MGDAGRRHRTVSQTGSSGLTARQPRDISPQTPTVRRGSGSGARMCRLPGGWHACMESRLRSMPTRSATHTQAGMRKSTQPRYGDRVAADPTCTVGAIVHRPSGLYDLGEDIAGVVFDGFTFSNRIPGFQALYSSTWRAVGTSGR